MASENLFDSNGTEEAVNHIGEALEEVPVFEKKAHKSEKEYFDRVIASKNATIETHKATIRELTEELNALKQAPVSED